MLLLVGIWLLYSPIQQCIKQPFSLRSVGFVVLFDMYFQERFKDLCKLVSCLDLVHLAVPSKAGPYIVIQVSYKFFGHDKQL